MCGTGTFPKPDLLSPPPMIPMNRRPPSLHCDTRDSSQAAEILGARLCAEHQPQHDRDVHPLRLVLRTQPRSFGCGFAALCPSCPCG